MGNSAIFQSDLRWCPRNFLHRYRLSFLLDGCKSVISPHEADATAAGQPAGNRRGMIDVADPLPADLSEVLRMLRPRDATSERLLQPWRTALSMKPAEPKQ